MKFTPVPKKVMTVHDVSCFGRCAHTVIIPVMSALGVQTVPLPTALLSTHTGGFDGFTFLDLTYQMTKIQGHWKKLGIAFDGIYTGFLGSEEQIGTVKSIAEKTKYDNPSSLFLADPVMGDDGEKYKTYTANMCLLTRELLKDANVITPNLTEACILTDTPYKNHFDDGELTSLLDRLSKLTDGSIVITGIRGTGKDSGRIYTVFRDGFTAFGKVSAEYIDANYPGTGDVFSSVLMSRLLYGNPLLESLELAGNFVSSVSKYTFGCGTPVREGLLIESFSAELASYSPFKNHIIKEP